MPPPRFVPFWFETNATHGPVRGVDDWKRILGEFLPGWDLERAAAEALDAASLAKEEHPLTDAERGDLPSIGTRREHVGGTKLRVWAQSHGMEETLALQAPPV